MYNAILFTDNTYDDLYSCFPSLGAYKVANSLRQAGYSVLVIDHTCKFSDNELKRLIDLSVNEETKLIGFSNTFVTNLDKNNPSKSMTTRSVMARGKSVEDEFVSYVKKKNKNIKFCVGGAWTSKHYRNPNIDYIFIGYSESSIVDLMNHLTLGTTLPNSFISDHGHTVIDDRTAPRYKFVEDRMTWKETDIVNTKVIPIEIGRGCIFKCKFCSYPLTGKKKLDYIKDPEILYEELLEAYTKYGIEQFIIVDDTFNDSIEKLNQVQDVVRRLPYQPKFWCYARLDLICSKPEMLPLMYEIGVRSMFFGIETMNLETGKIIGKGMDRQRLIDMLHHIANEYPDISTHGSFILGLPKESIESMKLTIEQIHNREIPLDYWSIGPLRINPESILTFVSDIEVNYKNYGYEIIEVLDDGTTLWKSDITTFQEVASLSVDNSKKAMMIGKIIGILALGFKSFGYEHHEIKDVRFADFDYLKLIHEVIPAYVKDYKNKLFSLIENEKARLAQR